MKTLDDCKNKVVRPYHITWNMVLSVYGGTGIPWKKINEAAELYGRYCRFVGYYQGKKNGYQDGCNDSTNTTYH